MNVTRRSYSTITISLRGSLLRKPIGRKMNIGLAHVHNPIRTHGQGLTRKVIIKISEIIREATVEVG
jgi:hypothetical protein